MTLRARFAALLFGASAPVREPGLPRATTIITDGHVSPEREAKLIEDGRKAVDDLLVRTHVERVSHFDAPRFGA